MKKLKLLLLLITAFAAGTATSSFAQAHKDDNKEIFIDAKGGIHNHKGTKLGYITKDNIVKNNKGKKLYFIDQNGNVIDANGTKLGMAKKNGDYINIKGETVLTLKDVDKEKCAILDPRGHNFGTAHKNYKLHACAAHCFFLEQEKQKEEAKKGKG